MLLILPSELQQSQTSDSLYEAEEVSLSFQELHRSVPWLRAAGDPAGRRCCRSRKGQLRILQAAIEYILQLQAELLETSEETQRFRLLAELRRPLKTVGNSGGHAQPAGQPTALQIWRRRQQRRRRRRLQRLLRRPQSAPGSLRRL
ncbi:hypothetical protein BOX15_Mlig025475g1 [Macrostomum lignano]|uniref:Uncharacterized protein n=2 Tax=Macrostomum lignano TaxID=282301 RepID=A0A267E742_9PLAT|nr:hypothetical protein BOX15_Mlig025475g1 [Macrostomum lignano]